MALAFAGLTFRFALCHEMAHVVLEHVDASTSELGSVKDADVPVWQVSQRQELEADRFGLGLQVKSLTDRTQLVTALASSVYFVHVTGLLDGRLWLLAHLVEYGNWKISHSHPPALHRVVNLMGAAQAFGDDRGAGLQSVHVSLANFDIEIYNAAKEQQDSVANETVSLLRNALTNVSTVRPIPATPAPAVTQDLRRFLDRQSSWVMRALEPGVIDISAAPAGTREKLQVLTEQLASTLPPELQRFRGLTRAQRAKEMA